MDRWLKAFIAIVALGMIGTFVYLDRRTRQSIEGDEAPAPAASVRSRANDDAPVVERRHGIPADVDQMKWAAEQAQHEAEMKRRRTEAEIRKMEEGDAAGYAPPEEDRSGVSDALLDQAYGNK